MTSNGQTKLFVGKHTGKLDDKKRLTIPAEWRFEAEADVKYVAFYHPADGLIRVLPPAKVQQIMDAALSPTLGDPKKSEAFDILGENSADFRCDKAGRVRLDDELLSSAGITKDVLFKGSFTWFRIMSPNCTGGKAETPEAKRFLEALRELGL